MISETVAKVPLSLSHLFAGEILRPWTIFLAKILITLTFYVVVVVIVQIAAVVVVVLVAFVDIVFVAFIVVVVIVVDIVIVVKSFGGFQVFRNRPSEVSRR